VLLVVLASILAAMACSTDTGEPAISSVAPGGADDAADESPVVAVDVDGSDPAGGDGVGEDSAQEAAVQRILDTLTVQQKVGQLLMPMVFGFGDAVTEAEAAQNLAAHGAATPAEIVARHRLGGVIYLENNIVSADQVRRFSSGLQASAVADAGIGLLVAVDQEGGRVSRLDDEVTSFPAASTMTGDAAEVESASYVTGQQVQEQGINVVLAPVADVVEDGSSFIGDRSFGSDPAVVAEMVTAAVQGLQRSGVAAAVKHWPGHGATPVDSHESLPRVEVDRALWDQRERVPFEQAIAADVAIVLVGHVALPQLAGTNDPATISPELIDGLLRDDLGFGGVVMTDALNMGAVNNGAGQADLVVDTILAGADIVLMPVSTEEAAAALLDAAVDGRISPERLDTSVRRVLRLKARLGLLPDPS
jgi:beta-N-acetylhexosaminidase